MPQEKKVCNNDNCYAKFYPDPNLEPGLCEECSKLVVEARIALLNELRDVLNSDIYWKRLHVETAKLKLLKG